jgi:hypothetical protein
MHGDIGPIREMQSRNFHRRCRKCPDSRACDLHALENWSVVAALLGRSAWQGFTDDGVDVTHRRGTA